MVTLYFDSGKRAPEAKSLAQIDLEADAHSRFLTLAWERWHKQLARTMYERCHATGTGGCSFVLTVTRNRDVTIKTLETFGDPIITQTVIAAAMSLDGNPLLSFPEGSQRQVVHESQSFICGHLAEGGYDWNKKDFEKIRQDF
jgi:hypothetical protein